MFFKRPRVSLSTPWVTCRLFFLSVFFEALWSWSLRCRRCAACSRCKKEKTTWQFFAICIAPRSLPRIYGLQICSQLFFLFREVLRRKCCVNLSLCLLPVQVYNEPKETVCGVSNKAENACKLQRYTVCKLPFSYLFCFVTFWETLRTLIHYYKHTVFTCYLCRSTTTPRKQFAKLERQRMRAICNDIRFANLLSIICFVSWSFEKHLQLFLLHYYKHTVVYLCRFTTNAREPLLKISRQRMCTICSEIENKMIHLEFRSVNINLCKVKIGESTTIALRQK